jgi:peptide deformylase
MSEFLTINTGDSSPTKQKTINPLKLFDENLPMLKSVMPYYNVLDLPNSHMNELVARLKMTMKLYGGIGLSANQCGVQERVFVIGTDYFQLVCINPKIIAKSDEVERVKEGCLTYPGLYVTVPRHKWVEVEFFTETGDRKEIRLDGLTAQCFQHELDHMNGVTFTSLVGPVALQLARQKQQKLINKVKKLKR